MSRNASKGSWQLGILIEEVEQGLAQREHLLAVARLALLVVADEPVQCRLLGRVGGVACQHRDLRACRDVLELDPVREQVDERDRLVDGQ